MKSRTTTKKTAATKTTTKKPALDAPIPWRPTAPPVAGPLFPTDDPVNALPFDVELFPNVRTLADLGISEARAAALSLHTHCLARPVYDLDDMKRRGRLLLDSFGFAVLLVSIRDAEEHQGDVIVYRHSKEIGVGAYGIGCIDLHTGRFIDNVQLAEREYAICKAVA